MDNPQKQQQQQQAPSLICHLTVAILAAGATTIVFLGARRSIWCDAKYMNKYRSIRINVYMHLYHELLYVCAVDQIPVDLRFASQAFSPIRTWDKSIWILAIRTICQIGCMQSCNRRHYQTFRIIHCQVILIIWTFLKHHFPSWTLCPVNCWLSWTITSQYWYSRCPSLPNSRSGLHCNPWTHGPLFCKPMGTIPLRTQEAGWNLF